jgi:hypothetical protein
MPPHYQLLRRDAARVTAQVNLTRREPFGYRDLGRKRAGLNSFGTVRVALRTKEMQRLSFHTWKI